MTANVEIKVSDRKDILKIPGAALRFTPSGADNPEIVSPGKGVKAWGVLEVVIDVLRRKLV